MARRRTTPRDPVLTGVVPMPAAGPVVAVLHPGRMGAVVAAAARAGGARVLWCPTGRSAATAARAAAAGLAPADDLAALLRAADVVLSVCPPVNAEEVAALVGDRGYGGLYVDANAVSPARLERIAATVTAGGARVVDGALFGPRHAGDGTRLYLSGPDADVAAVSALFAGTPLTTVAVAGGSGRASALKMAHSTFQKAARALAALAHALAAADGVTEHLLAEAAGLGSALAEPDRLPTVAAKAWRWEPELREVADTLAARGLPAGMALAAAAVLDRWRSEKDATGREPGDVLDLLVRER